MVHTGDAVAAGIVAGLERPGGNVTGMTYFLTELFAKRLELLRDAIPRMTRVATLVKPDNPMAQQRIDAVVILEDAVLSPT